jgi:hypothetical protein
MLRGSWRGFRFYLIIVLKVLKITADNRHEPV